MSKFLICECCNQTYLEEDMSKNNKNMCCCCWCFTRPKDKRIAELEEQLKNAIVPKFKIGQEVWFVNETLEVMHNGKINAFEVYKFKDRPYEFWYDIDYIEDNTEFSDEVSDEFMFVTKKEAEAKLKELTAKM